MRTVKEYIELVKDKHSKEIEFSTLEECIDLVVDNAFFSDEITFPIIQPLKEKIALAIKNANTN